MNAVPLYSRRPGEVATGFPGQSHGPEAGNAENPELSRARSLRQCSSRSMSTRGPADPRAPRLRAHGKCSQGRRSPSPQVRLPARLAAWRGLREVPSPMIVPASSPPSPLLRLYGVFLRLLRRLSLDELILTPPFDGLSLTQLSYPEPVAQLVEQRTFNP